MNKEFPIDKFFRKNSLKIALGLILLALFAILGPMMVPVAHHLALMNAMLTFLAGFMVVGVGAMGWQIYWRIKYPPQLEYCKECGRVLPIKYED